jgi:predicted MFS family arabinose efflux permease
MLGKKTENSNLGGFQLSGIVALMIISAYGALPFNMAPLLIGTIVTDFNASEASAGLLVSAELIAIALTIILLSAVAEKLPLRKLALAATLSLTAINLLSALPDNMTTLMVLRIGAGFAAGVMITIAYYLVGISTAPVRLFGLLTVGNVLVGVIFLMLLPSAIETWHYRGAYAVMAAPILVVAFLLVYIGHPENGNPQPESSAAGSLGWLALLFVVAVFLVQASEGGYYAFVELIGRRLLVAPDTIGLTLAASYLLSLGGSSLASILGDRFGVLKPLLIGMTGHALAVWFVVFASDQTAYLIPLLLQSLFFFLFLPYMLGLAATLDHSGHLSTLAGGVSLLGMGIGPFLSGTLVETWGYATIAYNVVGSVVVGYLLMLLVSRRMHARPGSGNSEPLANATL